MKIAIILFIFCCCILPAILGGMYMFIYSEEDQTTKTSGDDYQDYDISDLMSGGEIKVDSSGSPSMGGSDETKYYLKNGIYSIQYECDDPSIGCGQHLFYKEAVGDDTFPRIYVENKPEAEWEIQQVPGKSNVHKIRSVYNCEPAQPPDDCINVLNGKKCDPIPPDPHCEDYLGVVGAEKNNIRLAALSKSLKNHTFLITQTPTKDVYRVSPDHLQTKLLNMSRHSFEGKNRVGYQPSSSDRWKILYKRANHPIKPGDYYIQDYEGCINNHNLCSGFILVDFSSTEPHNLRVKRGEQQLWTIRPVDGVSDVYSIKLTGDCKNKCGHQWTRFKNTNRLGLHSIGTTRGIKILESTDYPNYYSIYMFDSEKNEYPVTWEQMDSNTGRLVTGGKLFLWKLTPKAEA